MSLRPLYLLAHLLPGHCLRLLAEDTPPDFYVCETEASCTPASSPGVPSYQMPELLQAGYRRMSDVASSGQRPLALHIGADGLRNPARWADVHLYTELLSHAGSAAEQLRLAFVEPDEAKAPDFWRNVGRLPTQRERVTLVTAMADVECPAPTKSMYRFGPKAIEEFNLDSHVVGGWVSFHPVWPQAQLKYWVDSGRPCPCNRGVGDCTASWKQLRNSNMSDYIVEMAIPCFTPAGLLDKLGASMEDLAMLVVDAEGLDATILRSIARDPHFNPGFIQWEAKFNGTRTQEAVAALRARGYKVGSKPGGLKWSTDALNVIAVRLGDHEPQM